MKSITLYQLLCAGLLLSPHLSSGSEENSKRKADTHIEQPITKKQRTETGVISNPSEKSATSTEALQGIIDGIPAGDYTNINQAHIIATASPLLESANLTIKAKQTGNSILHIAVVLGDSRFVSNILKKQKNLVSEANALGQTPLLMAAQYAMGGNAGWIIEKLAKHTPHEDINRKNKEGNTALHYALKRCMPYPARALAESGADFSLNDKDGNNCLALAEQSNSNNNVNKYALIDLVKKQTKKLTIPAQSVIAAQNPSLTATAPSTITTIAPAPKSGQRKNGTTLPTPTHKLINFIDQQISANGIQFNTDFKELEPILLQNPDVTVKNLHNKLQTSLLHLICQHGTLEQAQLVCGVAERKFTKAVKMVNNMQQTPLFVHLAFAKNPSTELITYLLENGAAETINIQEMTNSETVLHAAIRRAEELPNGVALVELIVKHGARTDLKDRNKATALDWIEKDLKNETIKTPLRKILQTKYTIAEDADADANNKKQKKTQTKPIVSPDGTYAIVNRTDQFTDEALIGCSITSVSPKEKVGAPVTVSAATIPNVETNTSAEEIATKLLVSIIESPTLGTANMRREVLEHQILPLGPNILIAAGPQKNTILHVIAQSGDNETAQIVQKKYDNEFAQMVYTKNGEGKTPLAIALEKNNYLMVSLFVNSTRDSSAHLHDTLCAVAMRAKDQLWHPILQDCYTRVSSTISTEQQQTLNKIIITHTGKDNALKLISGWITQKLLGK